MAQEKLTPMMQQYQELKGKYPDCLLFFRLGDFYELFGPDAVEGSRLLNLTLTKRHTTAMCGVPFHAIENYLGRLTKAGKKVAICEQMSDPALPGIVKRDVVRVVTPGTTFDERILEGKANHFVASVIFGKRKVAGEAIGTGETIGLALCDLTTGLFYVAAPRDLDELREELFRAQPAELIVDAAEKNVPEFLKHFEKLPVFPHQCWDEPRALLAKQFGVKDLRAFGIEEMGETVAAAALLIHYLRETQKTELAHVRPPQLLSRTNEMILDETAIRNLELLTTMRENSREGSLLAVLDMTLTSMGGRTLRQWLLHPLHDTAKIEERLDAVSELHTEYSLNSKIPEILTGVLDLERLLARLAVNAGNARDVLGIGISLKALEPLSQALENAKSLPLISLREEIKALASLAPLRNKILTTISENPPLALRDGGLIRHGINAELDELRTLSTEGKSFIQKLQEDEIKATGINSLKVRYNSVFGYYIEVTKANIPLVPERYIRKQTLVNAERYITPELKEYEEKVLGAEEKIKALEYMLFIQLRDEIQVHTREIQAAAQIFGTTDALLSLARIAEKNRYTRPHIVAATAPLVIKNGRHPVVEQLAGGGFVPNDTELSGIHEKGENRRSDFRLMLITGPNMGGKSTYLRQTALIALLAHIGSFVPADEAQIPLIDRIFTRVGASDNLVRGQSTFMVEMQETAHILHYATAESLIILDEIGRGTSTYDGVSLAWAILEFLHDHIGAKTLFATHYHELIAVAEKLPHAANFSVAVQEEGNEIVFLYRVLKGAIDRSYGIEVARLAGLPREVLEKAKTILVDLEEGILDEAIGTRAKAAHRDENQLEIFASATVSRLAPAPPSARDIRSHRVIEELKAVDVENMTPLAALAKLDELKNRLP